MVNLDIYIKVVRKKWGHRKDEWPLYVRELSERIREMKLGFTGINDDAISLVDFDTIKEGDMFVWDTCLKDTGRRHNDEAPLMLKKLENGKALIEGIGCGVDSVRDPDRIKYRWRNIIDMPNIEKDDLVVRLDSRPDVITGGSVYYWFYKAFRDSRY